MRYYQYSSSLYCCTMTTTLLMIILFVFFLGNNNVSSAAKTQLGPTSKDELGSSRDRQVLVDVAGYGEDKISNVLVTGSVLCDLSTHGGARVTSQPVSGAVVALKCNNISRKIIRRRGSLIKGVTDDYGDFTIDLPSHLHAIPDLHNKCFIKLIHLPNNFSCHCAYKPPVATSNSNKQHQEKGVSMFLAAANDDGLRTYSVGTIRLHHPRP